MKQVFERVGVFGMGLIGGSIAMGLRERFLAKEVHAYDVDASALETALAMGACDYGHTELGEWVGTLDLGILAAPVRALEPLAAAIAPLAAPDSRWIDVGSVKAPVVAALEPALPNYVGTHPMAGLERAGVQHAYAGLVQSAVWIITPTADTPDADVVVVRELLQGLGSYPLIVLPALHDRLVARVSHLPYLLAVALNLLIARDGDTDLLLFLAAGGFRDLTRVASGSPEMSRDMVVENKGAVRDALVDLQRVVGELADQLDTPEVLLGEAREAKHTRDALPVVKRTLLPRMYDVVVALPDRPMELARLTTVLGEAGVNIRDIEVLKIRGTGGEAIRVGVGSPDAQVLAREALTAAGYRVR